MWVEFDRARHEQLLAPGARVRLRKLRAFAGLFGLPGEAEIRGISGVRPFNYHVRYRFWGQPWHTHQWVTIRQFTHVWIPEDAAVDEAGTRL